MHDIRSDAEINIRTAVHEAQTAIMGTNGTGLRSTPPPQVATTADEDGNTIHVALYNVDAYDDPQAVYYHPKS